MEFVVYKIIYDYKVVPKINSNGLFETILEKRINDFQVVDLISQTTEGLTTNEVVRKLKSFTLLTELISAETFRELKSIPYKELDHVQKSQIKEFKHYRKIMKRFDKINEILKYLDPNDTWENLQLKIVGFKKGQRVYYNEKINDNDIEYEDYIVVLG